MMIVEDSEQVRRVMTTFLRGLVDEIVQIDDGCRALAAYTEHQPDLILMDIQMKQMDGLEATREIKTSYPKARVFMVSQWDSQALREAASEAGAEGYINKADLLPLVEIIKGHRFEL